MLSSAYSAGLCGIDGFIVTVECNVREKLEGFEQKVASSSTVVGAAILNAIIARACELLLAEGIQPPVFMSGNLEGGDAYNKAVIAEHKDNIFYM